jgi:hypothetical protein
MGTAADIPKEITKMLNAYLNFIGMPLLAIQNLLTQTKQKFN